MTAGRPASRRTAETFPLKTTTSLSRRVRHAGRSGAPLSQLDNVCWEPDMTPIVGSRTVVRKTACRVRDGGRARELVVTLNPEFLTLRLHGTRREETVSYEGAFFGAIKSRVF